MRADRLVSLVLLLRQRGKMSATALATELEVSTRTVLRDIEALSTAGVPVYAERGRGGGFALLPGFRTELTGLADDEALALLVAGSRRGAQVLGLGPALSAAMLKVIDALPDAGRATADVSQRLLIDAGTDLLARPLPVDHLPADVMGPVRLAVLEGRKLRIRYAARWRTIDPLGLVTVRDLGYLLALHDGADRTYRVSRIEAAQALPEPAERPEHIDLAAAWRARAEAFRTGGDLITVTLRLAPERRTQLAETAVVILMEKVDADGWLRLDVTFQDLRHATWAVWQFATDAEVVAPPELRTRMRDRAEALVAHYEPH